MNEKKGVAINPYSNIHYCDHLAPICKIMGIPLLFLDPEEMDTISRFYPDLHAEYVPFQEFNPEMLITNFDVVFLSDLWDRTVFREKFAPLEKKYGKTIRHVHCPHGFSDKSFYLRKCAQEDITLLYGQNMLDQLKDEHVFNDLHSYVITGNYRYTYYQMHQAFYENLVQEEVLSRFIQEGPIVLYAPTWVDFEQSTTFYESTGTLIDALPKDWNMIIKMHPRLEHDDPAMYYQILGKYDSKPNVIFLKEFTPVYPLLAHTDVYIGDMSSVGYDFLTFNRPMYFLNKFKRDPKKDRRLYLTRCGITVEPEPEQLSQIYQMIKANLDQDKEHNQDQKQFGKIRKEVYQYTFGEEKSFLDIKREIVQAYSSPEKMQLR